MMVRSLTLVLFALLTASCCQSAETVFYVAPPPAGNDAWTGRLAAPNANRTDGPFATLNRAREAVRNLRTKGSAAGPVSVQLRQGRYCLDQTLTLGPEDAGSKEAPVSWARYQNEKPQIIGGRLISGLKPVGGGKWAVTLPQVQAGNWNFKSLFIDGKRMIRARYPNYEASDPYRKGFLYAANDINSFGTSVGCIHNVGDWMEYEVNVPAAGEYTFWMYYGALNKPHGNDNMGGRTVLIADGGEPIPLLNLPDTGGWGALKWSPAATVKLTAGKHVLRWQNKVGGGLNLTMFALSDDPEWKPVDTKMTPVPEGKHRVMIPAASFVRSEGKQLQVGNSGGGSKDMIYFAPGEVKPEWAQAPGAEVHIFQSGNCRAFLEIAGIKNIDLLERRLELSGKELSSGLNVGDRFWVENVAAELDAPGEWYLDTQTGVLTLMAPAGFSAKSEVMAPTVGRVIEVIDGAKPEEAVSNLSFSGLTIRGGEWSADDGVIGYGMGRNGVLFFQNATGCAVKNCSFVNIGKDAVCFSGGGGNTIIGNDITDSAEGAINIDGSNENEISGNHIHHCGQVYKHNGGVCLQNGASRNHVAGNMIHDMTRYGITMKLAGTENVVEYNRVLNTSLETYDTGAIEVTQGDRNALSGSKIHHNIVGDSIGYSAIGEKPTFLSWSIYLDSFAGGYDVYDNICYRSNNGGIMFQGGKGNNVHNNLFVDGRAGQGHISNFLDNFADEKMNNNIFSFSRPTAVLFGTGKLHDGNFVADRNLYWCSAGDDPEIGGWDTRLFADWQKRGFDVNGLYADPQFVNPAKDDYSLRPTSPAFKLGFQKIDTSKIAKPCGCKMVPQGPIFFADTSK
ncbi:MAG: right-handed parallel beta-helix repeat-containing protein [Armatimonadota bacterium]